MINLVFIHGRVLAHPCTWDIAASPVCGQSSERPVIPTPPRGHDWTRPDWGCLSGASQSLSGHTPRLRSERAGRTLISETNICGFPLCPFPKGHVRYRGACTWPETLRARWGGGGPGLRAARLLRGNVPLRVEPLVVSKAGPETPETA